jgi:hypothetical protein
MTQPDIKALRRIAEEAWQALLDKDDRTSPAEYPDMCLITKDELEGFLLSSHDALEEASKRYREALTEIAGPANADLDYRQLHNGCQDIARQALEPPHD